MKITLYKTCIECGAERAFRVVKRLTDMGMNGQRLSIGSRKVVTLGSETTLVCFFLFFCLRDHVMLPSFLRFLSIYMTCIYMHMVGNFCLYVLSRLFSSGCSAFGTSRPCKIPFTYYYYTIIPLNTTIRNQLIRPKKRKYIHFHKYTPVIQI